MRRTTSGSLFSAGADVATVKTVIGLEEKVTVLVYADADNLAEWLGEPAPDNATSLLRHASSRVANACRCDIYGTQPNGLPVDDDIREALRDTTYAG